MYYNSIEIYFQFFTYRFFSFSDCDAPFQVNFYTDTSNDGTTSAQRGKKLQKLYEIEKIITDLNFSTFFIQEPVCNTNK